MLMQIQSDTSPEVILKRAELRARTDRDLAVLLRRTLEFGFERVAQSEYADAEAAYAQASRLLRLTGGLQAPEFTSLQTRLHDLRVYLDEVELACLAS